jgi:hypothetical protein
MIASCAHRWAPQFPSYFRSNRSKTRVCSRARRGRQSRRPTCSAPSPNRPKLVVCRWRDTLHPESISRRHRLSACAASSTASRPFLLWIRCRLRRVFSASSGWCATGRGWYQRSSQMNWRLTPDSVVFRVIADSTGSHERRRRQLADRLIDFWRFQMATKQFEGPMNWQQLHERGMRDLRAMRAVGVPMMTGTDFGAVLVFPGSSPHEELVLMQEKIGMTTAEILQSATRNRRDSLALRTRLVLSPRDTWPISYYSTRIRSTTFGTRGASRQLYCVASSSTAEGLIRCSALPSTDPALSPLLRQLD